MTQEIEQKSLLKGILTLSVPTMLGMMFETLYEIVDMAWVAKLSINSVAAVTIFSTVWWILNMVNDIVGTSSVSIISRFYGSGDKEKTIEAIEQTIIFKFLLAFIVGILMSFIIPYILSPLAGNREVLTLSTTYGRIRLITLPLAFSSYSVNTALRCIGDARKPLYIMALSGVLNMILDPIMIFDVIPYIGIRGMGLGIAGAAYATVISQALAFAVGLYILMSGKSSIRIGFKRGIYFVKSIDMKLLKIGLPTGLEGLLRNMGSFLIMRFIASYGVVVVAAFGICVRIIGLIVMPVFGLQMGTGVIVGQSLGSADCKRAEEAGYLTAKLSFGFMFATGLILVFFPGLIMNIFTTSEEIIGIGTSFLRYFAFAALFMGPAGSLASILCGAGDNIPSMLAALISIWLVQIPLLYVLVQLMQLRVEWVWISYIVAYAVHYIVILYYVKKGKWKNICV
ncbi:MAG: MATE family efflux transporter, partial [Clostridiaceae bacterium]|nr:MATE family efflux transporter [Clostridiaceae bacterium]